MADYWWIATDNLIMIEGLKNRLTGDYIPDLDTITATVKDSDGNALDCSPLTFTYVAGSNGSYSAIIPQSQALTAGEYYKVTISIISGSNKETRVIYRKASYMNENND